MWRKRNWPVGFEVLEDRVLLSAVKWTPDFELLNSENPEGEPWLSASPDGRFSLVFFETLAGPPVHNDLEERIYTAGGVEQSAIGTTFSAATNEHQPASAYLPDGRRVTVWTEEPTAGGGNLEDVFAEIRFGNNIVDVARFLVTGGAGRQHDPIVAANSSGFAVAVADDSVAGGRLILKFYNIAGTLVNTVLAPNAPQTVAVGVNGDQFRDVEIAALANGNYAIAWDNGSNQNIFARVFSSGGVAQSGVIDVETGAPGASFPDVTALADGRFAVTYAEYIAVNVRGRIYQANGTPDGVGFAIGTGFANAVDNQLQTAALHDGRFVTVWKTIAGEIAGQVMFADGTQDSASFTVNTNTAGDQSRPTIATLADGRFAVSWESGAGAAPETIITTIFDARDAGLNGSASSFNDDWFGTTFADQVFGGAGGDAIRGAGSADILYGESGNDTLNGDAGADQLFGGNNNDILNGGADNDTLRGELGNDTLNGDAGDDQLFGEGNNDILNGGIDNDTLNGGGGIDTLNGDAGDDSLIGGTGGDVLNGGVGGQRDVITDFLKVELDKIDVSLIDGMAGTGGVNGFTSFIGNAAFTAEGQIRAFQSGANTVVEFNTTGITGAEMHILLLNFTAGTLALSDFITAGGFALAAPSSTNRTTDRDTLRMATSSLQLTLSPSQKATLPTLSRAATTGTGNRSSVPIRLPTPAIAATATGLKKRTAAISQSGTILNAADLSRQLKSLDDLFASESFAASPQ